DQEEDREETDRQKDSACYTALDAEGREDAVSRQEGRAQEGRKEIGGPTKEAPLGADHPGAAAICAA
ncbi:MAG: hypothetical protein ACTHLO_10955, partial [Pseudolabrys sp.]